MNNTFTRWILTLSFVTVFSALSIASLPDSSSNTPAPTPIEDTTPPVEIKLADLQKEYKKDEAGTNAKHKGKWLIVTGLVYSTLTGSGAMIGLSVNRQGPPAMARMAAGEESKVDGLKDWSTVKVKCKANEYFMDAPSFEDCSLLQVVKGPPAARSTGSGGGGRVLQNGQIPGYSDCISRLMATCPRCSIKTCCDEVGGDNYKPGAFPTCEKHQ